jgi:hypothetical protein
MQIERFLKYFSMFSGFSNNFHLKNGKTKENTSSPVEFIVNGDHGRGCARGWGRAVA